MKSKFPAKKRVLVAMSGGVDSSVAALMMKKKGCEVVGVFMKNWSSQGKKGLGECDWAKERDHAMKIAEILNIPLVTFDFEKEYRKKVVDKMFKDYRRGITPNPDIDCNEKVKFPMLLKVAKNLGADFVVTGHYARIKKIRVHKRDSYNVKNSGLSVKNKRVSASNGEQQYRLLRAKDESKDQSYFLYRMKQEELKKTLFPIGDYTKKQIREIARKNNFPNHGKKSTVGICFIGKVDLKKFLKKKIKPKMGKILGPRGEIVGEHDGIYYYTIGQRLGPRYGMDVSKNSDNKNNLKKWYVAKKDPRKNIIVAAPENHELLYRREFFLKNPYWIGKKPKANEKVFARIRQVGELLQCTLSNKREKYKVILKNPITGISQGQACVLYKGEEVLGGGEIRFG